MDEAPDPGNPETVDCIAYVGHLRPTSDVGSIHADLKAGVLNIGAILFPSKARRDAVLTG